MGGATVRGVGQASDGPRTMSVREFLKGGYRERAGPVIVLSLGEVAGVWSPGGASISVSPPKVSQNGSALPPASYKGAPGDTRTVTVVGMDQPNRTITVRPVPKPGKKR